MKIVLASRNKKKLEELKRLLGEVGGAGNSEKTDIVLLSLEDFPGAPEVIEDGTTFEENAIKKALQTAKATGLPAIADDSGLVVEALGGAPGVYSARYAGEPSDDRRNIEKLLRELEGVPPEKRQAHFECVIAFATPDGMVKTFTGRVDGIITEEPRGEAGFGYDPVFQPEGLDRTFAEVSKEEKDSMSHRYRAIRLLKEYLKQVAKATTDSGTTKVVRNKKIILLISLLLTIIFFSSIGGLIAVVHAFSEKGNCKTCHRLTMEEAQNLLQGGPELKVIDVIDSPLKGLWEVNFEAQGRKGLVYIDYGKKFIIAGNIFSSSTKQNLTQERLSYLNRVDPSTIDLKDALVLGKRDARYKVIVFDDPD